MNAMADTYDPYREALVMETETVWPDEYADMPLQERTRIAYALHKMNVGGYRHIPILFEGKLAGVISIRDILRYLTERIAAAARR